MDATRRNLLAMAAAAGLAPGRAFAEAPSPLVIAEAGGGGPAGAAHSAYELAIRQGADFLSAGLAITRDGVLIVGSDNEISATTDVAARAEFADRRTTKTIDGRATAGWFSEDFTLAELTSLNGRADSAAASPATTFQTLIDIARAGSVRTGRIIGVYAQMLHPAYFASIGMPIERPLADIIRAAGYDSPAAAMFVRSTEIGALKTLAGLSRVRRAQIIARQGGPPGEGAPPFAEMITPAGLRTVRAYAQAIAPDGALVAGGRGDADQGPVAWAHAAGLLVHADGGESRDEAQLTALFAGGIDGLFTGAPDLAVRARGRAAAALRRRETSRR